MKTRLSRLVCPRKSRLKKNAKVMIRRNIDTSLGLVNGTLYVVDSITRSVTSEVEKVNVRLLSGEIHGIERIRVTFEILTGVYVNREQFPLILSYAITVHKNQGISLKTVVIDAGVHNFAKGQIYVALSRVTSLNGLHLINYDTFKVVADTLAILQYNFLRQKFRPDLVGYCLPPRVAVIITMLNRFGLF